MHWERRRTRCTERGRQRLLGCLSIAFLPWSMLMCDTWQSDWSAGFWAINLYQGSPWSKHEPSALQNSSEIYRLSHRTPLRQMRIAQMWPICPAKPKLFQQLWPQVMKDPHVYVSETKLLGNPGNNVASSPELCTSVPWICGRRLQKELFDHLMYRVIDLCGAQTNTGRYVLCGGDYLCKTYLLALVHDTSSLSGEAKGG